MPNRYIRVSGALCTYAIIEKVDCRYAIDVTPKKISHKDVTMAAIDPKMQQHPISKQLSSEDSDEDGLDGLDDEDGLRLDGRDLDSAFFHPKNTI
ncbi:hypothetical protein CRG98_011497 [Punica granatum]|uniref:Uncharacterized protein n=1 Tax=Punica granatum TaxID=22663 RepID=A0A2I0KHF7_PUNGR|nr:hypothetical protein CRG98_011497 [Punica granatum]